MRTKSNNVRWIVAMMIASQLLLMLFTGNWLYVQYQKEKEQLSKDVKMVLVQANDEVHDSALLHKLVYPIMYRVKADGITKDTLISSKYDKRNAQVTYKIVVNGDSSITKDLIGNKTQDSIITSIKAKMGHIPDLQMHRVNTETMNGAYIYSSDSTTEIVKTMLPAILKQVMAVGQDHGGLSDTIFWMDTTAVRTSFSKKAKANNWAFKTEIYYNTEDKPQGKGITISTKSMMHVSNVMVEGYGWHLFKKISPQVAFVFILLVLTGASFLFAYRSLRQSILLNTIKNDFISNMSHELKTPISTVKVALEALDNFNVIQDVNTTREYIRMAGLEMSRLDMLVNKTLNASLLEQGKIVLQKEQLDIRQLVEETVTLMSFRFQQHNAQVQTIFKGDDFMGSADKLHLQGVLINVLDNSLKYANRKPSIAITLTAAPDSLSIAVADNGPGINEAYIKRIFDKFFRVPMGDTHNVKGYGLGLSYAKQIMSLHKGSITVYNLSIEGCAFTINLPRA